MRLGAAQRKQLLEKGYIHLPRLVPRPLLDKALIAINHALGLMPLRRSADPYQRDWEPADSSSAVMDLLYKSPAFPLAESLAGPGTLEPLDRANIFLRFPQLERKSGGPLTHVDGIEMEGSHKRAGRIQSCTMKLCVLLSDVPAPDSGNFVVVPGSHLALTEHCRREGTKSLQRGMPELDLAPPVQIVGQAGDAVLAHYMLSHDRAQNLRPHIRYAVFFNLRRAGHFERQDKTFLDPWLEWPGLKRRS